MTKKLFSALLLITALISCNNENYIKEKPNFKNRKLTIVNFIHEDTGLQIDTTFTILKDSVKYIDQDYTVFWTIQYDTMLKRKIINQIINSKYFNVKFILTNNNKFWEQLISDSLKGYWQKKDNGFEFVDIEWSESYAKQLKKTWMIETKIDTVNNILDYKFIKI